MRPTAVVVERLMLRALRGAFRRVCWVGEPPALPPGMPVVLYANHHNFYDGYLGWLIARRLLRRPVITWMEAWDRFPFFGAAGALPFPPDDARRRAATIRHTVRRLRTKPETVLIYFPEGRLHRPEEGVDPFDTEAFSRMDRLLPAKHWWPVGIHVTYWGESLPTVLLGGGTPHAAATGREAALLADVWQAVRNASPETAAPLLEGRHSPSERWDLSFLRRFFEPSP